MRMTARRFADSILGLEERQNRHENQRACQDPDDLHDLLFPWRRSDQMACLEILEIVSAHRSGAADDCSDHQCGRRSRWMSSPIKNTSSRAAIIMVAIVTPETGLLELPTIPAI